MLPSPVCPDVALSLLKHARGAISRPELIPTFSAASEKRTQSIRLALLMTGPARGSRKSTGLRRGAFWEEPSRTAPFEEDKECVKCLRSLYSLRVSISSAGRSLTLTMCRVPCASLGGRRLQPDVPWWCASFMVPQSPVLVLEVSGTLSPGSKQLMGGRSVPGQRIQDRVLSRETLARKALGKCCVSCFLSSRPQV